MSAPSPFVSLWVPRLASHLPPSARAIDLAAGSGRHLPILAHAGFRTFAVDRSWILVQQAVADAARRGATVRGFCADLTSYPLPTAAFDLVVITRYLDRSRMPDFKAALAPGGYIVYETFTRAQRAHGWGPTSPAHLLEHGELARSFTDFEIVFVEEVSDPEAVARLVGRRPRQDTPGR